MNTIAIPRPLDPRATPTLRSGMPARSPITISRVIRDEAEVLVSCALPGDDAYAASIAVRDLPSVDIWLHNRRVARAGCAAIRQVFTWRRRLSKTFRRTQACVRRLARS